MRRQSVDLVRALGIAKQADERFARAAELATAFAASVEGRIAGELRARATEILARHPWDS